MMDLLNVGLSWFPEEYASTFFWVKGITSLLATVLVIKHMDTAFGEPDISRGRRMRYYALLVASISITGGSVDQVRSESGVELSHLGGMATAFTILVAMVVSIRESRRES